MEGSSEAKYGVYRLDINRAPGWFLVQSYKDVRDADIYCDMLNQGTGMVHRVFEVDDE